MPALAQRAWLRRSRWRNGLLRLACIATLRRLAVSLLAETLLLVALLRGALLRIGLLPVGLLSLRDWLRIIGLRSRRGIGSCGALGDRCGLRRRRHGVLGNGGFLLDCRGFGSSFRSCGSTNGSGVKGIGGIIRGGHYLGLGNVDLLQVCAAGSAKPGAGICGGSAVGAYLLAHRSPLLEGVVRAACATRGQQTPPCMRCECEGRAGAPAQGRGARAAVLAMHESARSWYSGAVF